MKIINYISISAMPIIILIIIVYSYIEKNKIFDVFLEGAKEGVLIVYKIFPTLIGLFVAVGALRNSGLIDLIINLISPIIKNTIIPTEIMPLAILRPISGSAAMAIATDIIKIYGVDSKIGQITSVIMGSTETTIYTIAVYTSCIKVKNTRGILLPALIADAVGIIIAVIICSFL
jgi:spore maturation protein B